MHGKDEVISPTLIEGSNKDKASGIFTWKLFYVYSYFYPYVIYSLFVI